MSQPPSMPVKPSRSLQRRLLVMLGAIGTATLILVSISVMVFIYRSERATWRERQQEVARAASTRISDFLHHTQDALTFVGILSPEYLDADSRVLSTVLHDTPALLELVRLDASAGVLLGDYADRPLLAETARTSEADWFQRAPADRLYLGDIHLSDDGSPYFILSMLAPDGGVVAARMSTSALTDVVADVNFGRTSQAYLVDANGTIVAHKNQDYVLTPELLDGRLEMAALSASPDRNWQGGYVNLEDDLVVGTTFAISGSDWTVVTELSQQEAFATSRAAFVSLVSSVLVVGLVVMLGSVPIVRTAIFDPLHQLRAGAERIGSGELSHRIFMNRNDEIGQVADAFNHMALRLQVRNQDTLRARDEALTANRLKSEILARVSHELRTPLGAILGYSEMIAGGHYGPVTPEQRSKLKRIVESSDYLTRTVSDLLELSRLEADKINLHYDSFFPADLVSTVQSNMAMLAASKGLSLTTILDPDLPESICSDPTRVRQILVNLVGNAIKFTDRGEINVRLFKPEMNQWAMQVSDTGPGIPDDAHRYIFEPFRQLDGLETRDHGGSGLGLSIVRELAQKLGGKITLESEVGRGSTFTVSLPLQRENGI